MTSKLIIIFFLLFLTTLLNGAAVSLLAPGQVYVEPDLAAVEADTVSVIVTANDSLATAATAVERLGGQVISDLWLIEAVAATLPTDQLPALAAEPGIVSIFRACGTDFPVCPAL
jgi:hypothetical protein